MLCADHPARALRLAALVSLLSLVACATLAPPRDSATAPQASGEPAAPVDPEERQALRPFMLALDVMKAGRDKEAEKMLVALTRRFPGFAGPYANLGVLYHRLGRLEDAEAVLNKAIEANPGHAAYHNQLGIVLRARGKFDDARAAYERALAVNDNYALAHLNIGILYDLYLGERGKALTHYQRYQQLTGAQDRQVAKWIVDLQQRERAASPGEKDKG